MHKIRICIPIFLIIVSGTLCILKTADLIELKEKKNHLVQSKKKIDDFAREIKKNSFDCLKSGEKLFAKEDDIKKCIQKVVQKFDFKKVLIKRDSSQNIQEIKVIASEEQEIYKLINELFFELPGIICFKSIKLFPIEKGGISAVIQFISETTEKCPNFAFRREFDRKYDSVTLFKQTKTHKLFCIIDGSKAYIDNSWFKIGDRIDDGIIKYIDQNFIEIQKDFSDKIRVKLGKQW